jgi:hypothetical protein
MSDSFDGFRFSVPLDFEADCGFIFIEAVADHALSERLLLPHWNAHVSRGERLPVGTEVNDLTACLGAEATVRHVQPSKSVLGQQCLHGEQIDGCSSGAARLTPGHAAAVS